jgi:hypothetical protein
MSSFENICFVDSSAISNVEKKQTCVFRKKKKKTKQKTVLLLNESFDLFQKKNRWRMKAVHINDKNQVNTRTIER